MFAGAVKSPLIALLLMSMPSVALAQSDQDWKSCNAEDADAALSACTRLIKTEKLDPEKRSTALSSRAAAYWRKHDYDRAVADADKAIELIRKILMPICDEVRAISATAITKGPSLTSTKRSISIPGTSRPTATAVSFIQFNENTNEQFLMPPKPSRSIQNFPTPMPCAEMPTKAKVTTTGPLPTLQRRSN